jgi:hypothetical protein
VRKPPPRIEAKEIRTMRRSNWNACRPRLVPVLAISILLAGCSSVPVVPTRGSPTAAPSHAAAATQAEASVAFASTGPTSSLGAIPEETYTSTTPSASPAESAVPSASTQRTIWRRSAPLPFDAEGTFGWTPRTGFLLANLGPGLARSDDGLIWQAAQIPEDQRSVLSAFASNGTVAVAVGREDRNTGSRAAVWWSPDGSTWSRVADSSLFAPDPAYLDQGHAFDLIEGVSQIEGRFVAIGYENTQHGCEGICYGQFETMMWSSTDGRDWTRIPLTPAQGAIWCNRLVASNGRFLAYPDDTGTFFLGVPRGEKGLVSDDGVTWTPVHLPPLVTILGTPTVFIAAGIGHDTIYTSHDGVTWNVALRRTQSFPRIWTGFAQVAGGDVLVGGRDHAVVLASPDGMTWHQASDDPPMERMQPTGIASDGTRLVLLGQLQAGAEKSVNTWVTEVLP